MQNATLSIDINNNQLGESDIKHLLNICQRQSVCSLRLSNNGLVDETAKLLLNGISPSVTRLTLLNNSIGTESAGIIAINTTLN